MNTTVNRAGQVGTATLATTVSARQWFATLKVALVNAALVAAPVLFVLVEAAGRRAAP
jgi:hypothetical protein